MSISFEAAFKDIRDFLKKKVDVGHGLLQLLQDKRVLTPLHVADIKVQ